jgi:hypothetical protein
MCQSEVVEDCASEYLAFLQCLADFMGPPDCDMPMQCEPAMDAYLFCEGPTPPPDCEPGPCYAGSDGSCGCDAECTDGSVYATDCVPAGSGTVVCSCTIDAVPVGSCSDPMGMEACDIFAGCCASFFFGWQ